MPDALDPLARFLTAIERRDRGELAAIVADDAAWHIPGRNHLAGFHKGREELLALNETVTRWTAGTFHLEPHDLVGNERHVVLLAQASGRRRGEELAVGLGDDVPPRG